MSGIVCEACKKEVATIHITEIAGDQRTERHLCEACAKAERIPEVPPHTSAIRVHMPDKVVEVQREGAPWTHVVCANCCEQPATVQIVIVEPGRRRERNLCERCARETERMFPHRPAQPAEVVRVPMKLVDQAREAIAASARVKAQFAEKAATDIAHAAQVVAECLGRGGKVLLCGNGGSAADAQHIAGELVGRFKLERPAFHAVALTTDTSVLTSIANDYGFEDVFARQVGGLGAEGDVLMAYSTSGNSKNVLRGIQAAKIVGMKVIGLTGEGGGQMAHVCDVLIAAPSADTPTVQECHAAAGHTICLLVERLLCGGS